MRFFLILVIIAFSLSPLATHAASVAGIVLEISDAQDAQITAPSEIRSGTTIALGKNGRIKFLRYLGCDQITAAGGTVTVFVDHYTASDSRISDLRHSCPNLIRLTKHLPRPGDPGYVFDLGPERIALSSHPMIVVMGKCGPSYTSLAFQPSFGRNIDATRASFTTKVINGFAQVPDTGLSRGDYELTLTSPDGRPLKIEAYAEDLPDGQSLSIVWIGD